MHAKPRPRISTASLPPGIRWRLWRRAQEHRARNALLRILQSLLGSKPTAHVPANVETSPKRLLLVRTGRAIGDMVMALSLIAECRRLLPGARIECLMRESLVPFFDGATDLDALHALPRRSFLRPVAMARLFRTLRSGWDVVITCDTPHKSSLTALCLCLASRAPRRIGFDNEEGRPFLTETVSALPGIPMRANLCRLAHPLADGTRPPADPPSPLPRLGPTPAALATANILIGERPSPAIIFVSGHWSKGWPLAAWLRVASCLTLDGHHTWLAFGPGDPRAGDPSVIGWIAASQGLGDALLPQEPQIFLALLARCRLFMSNDCGPYHLAIAAGACCVAVFPTPEARRDFGYEHPGRLVAIYDPNPTAAETRASDAALALIR